MIEFIQTKADQSEAQIYEKQPFCVNKSGAPRLLVLIQQISFAKNAASALTRFALNEMFN